MYRIVISRFIAILTLVFAPTHPTYGRTPDFTDSIADSKKQHVFRKSVRVVPDHFEWEGHKVLVVESWMEGFWLRFKFEVDGNCLNQNRIQRKERQFLSLDQEIPERGYAPSSYTVRRGLDHILGGTNGEVIYYMSVKQPEPDQIKLRVRTTKIDRTAKPMIKNVPSDTILTFYLDEPEKVNQADNQR